MKIVDLKIGTKLVTTFVMVAILVAAAGVVGILMIGIIGTEMDTILDEKVPFKDVSMEAIIALISTRDACGEY